MPTTETLNRAGLKVRIGHSVRLGLTMGLGFRVRNNPVTMRSRPSGPTTVFRLKIGPSKLTDNLPYRVP